MNNLNQAILTIAVIIVSLWIYQRWSSKTEKYETDKEVLINYINNKAELDPIFIQISIAKLTNKEDIIMSSYELAVSGDRTKLLEMINKL